LFLEHIVRKALLALPLLIAVPLLAQMPPPPGKPNRNLVKKGSYQLDGGHTQVLFAYAHMGLTDNMGLLSGGTGGLTIDPANPGSATVSVEMPLNTIRTTINKLDEELQGSNFFDTVHFPTAKFVSTAVRAKGENSTSATVYGNLTIHGVTKQVAMKASFAAAGMSTMGGKNDNVTFNATTTIRRSDFGLGYGVPLVGDEVTLRIVAAFTKPAP
jgi:polyisoprenoid-binding protein YceI